jgi:predicted AlkP superfamily pyrophosphatase or phosphodiesterase
MKKKILIIVLSVLCFTSLFSQQRKSPKLVVGIIVDQMREEYLYRFYNQYGENGFKRLMREGFYCRNIHFNYTPTVTGSGHASVYAGSTPAYHGIVSNDWYDRKLKRTVYCCEDTTVQLLGTSSTGKGMSPHRLLSTNLPDELKISTMEKAKVIGISLKDRAAILPAGHMANAAYWFDTNNGNFITSTYYMKKLPEWVERFNNEKHSAKYLEKTWNLLKPIESYPFSLPDDNNYEGKFKGKDKPVFPYNLKELSAQNPPLYSILYNSALGNSILTDFVLETIAQENIGKGEVTDLLAISYSSPDAIGHKFGPLSKEVNDNYLRLDEDIARLLETLDQKVGKGEYIVFLTADHGVSESPKYLIDHGIPAGYLLADSLQKSMSMFLDKKYGQDKWLEHFDGSNVYLNRTLIGSKGISLADMQYELADFLRNFDGIAQVYTATQLERQSFTQHFPQLLQNGFYYKRSGDVMIITEPGWTDEPGIAATHGSGYSYDTHVPFIISGPGIAKGESFETYTITDIVPTLAMLLKIKLPSACMGKPIAKAIAQ